MIRLNVGDNVIIRTPCCATNPYGIGKDIEGKSATVLTAQNWTKSQGIFVIVDDTNNLISGFSYYCGKEFELISSNKIEARGRI